MTAEPAAACGAVLVRWTGSFPLKRSLSNEVLKFIALVLIFGQLEWGPLTVMQKFARDYIHQRARRQNRKSIHAGIGKDRMVLRFEAQLIFLRSQSQGYRSPFILSQ